eukprot:scaffold2325_cov228-Ochromonas_danica.AAC.1
MSQNGVVENPMPTTPDEIKLRLFHDACADGDTEIVKDLIKGLDVNQPNKDEFSALHFASFKGHVEVYGWSPFHLAIFGGHLEMVKLFYSDPRVDVNQGNKDGWCSPLHFASAVGQVEVVKVLLSDPRVDVHKAGEYGWSPLHYACKNGSVEVVKVLLSDPRFDVNLANNNQWSSPFHVACGLGRVEVIKVLLNDPRVDVNKAIEYGWSPLHFACLDGAIEVVKVLLSDPRVDVNLGNNAGWSPLHIASGKGHVEVVKVLLSDPRVDVNKGYEPFPVVAGMFKKLAGWFSFDMPPLMKYAYKILLAQPSTALAYACFCGQDEVVNILMADPRVNVGVYIRVVCAAELLFRP